MARFDPSTPVDQHFRSGVADALAEFIERRGADLRTISPAVAPLATLAESFTAGGKRLRPAFCYWGSVAVAGEPTDPDALLRASASLDLLHVSALVHDDVMDASDTRRGIPAAHRQFEAQFRERGGRGEADAFGRAGAILLGDLLLVWSAELFTSSGLSPAALDRARPFLDEVRTEVTTGQFLDVLAQALPYRDTTTDLDAELTLVDTVVEYKSARYSVMRPLQIGAALGGADDQTQAALAGFGSPLGRAFQFRYDLLGVFGDEELTGKPTGGDLREGKRTLLVVHALAQAQTSAGDQLRLLLGDRELTAEQVAQAQQIITESGAVQQVEDQIARLLDRALNTLQTAQLTDEGRTALTALAQAAVHRTS